MSASARRLLMAAEAPPPPFDATDYGTVLFWVSADEASTITESSGAVSQWRDRSGNSYHMSQATGANQPTTGTRTVNGRNVIDFDGGDFMKGTVGPNLWTTKAHTLVIVYAVDAEAAAAQGIAGFALAGGYDYRSLHYERRTTLGAYGVGDNDGASAPSSSQYIGYDTDSAVGGTATQIAVVRTSTTANSLRMDGAAASVTAFSGSMNLSRYAVASNHVNAIVGARHGGGTANFHMNGHVAEVILYNSVLTGSNLTGLEAALATKWGVTI